MSRTGSSVTVRQEATGRSFTLLRERVGGERKETIDFVLSESEWSPEIFASVRAALEGAPFIEGCEVRGKPPHRVLDCQIAMGSVRFSVEQLIAAVPTACGLDECDTFALRIRLW